MSYKETILPLVLLLNFLTHTAVSADRKMLCQVEMCGPDSFMEVYFTDKNVFFEFVRNRDSYPFNTILQQADLLTENQDVEKMTFSFDSKDCQMARDNLADFACSGYTTWANAQLIGYTGSSFSEYKMSEKVYDKTNPLRIEIKSMATSAPNLFRQYTWNIRLINGHKTYEQQIDLGQCTFN